MNVGYIGQFPIDESHFLPAGNKNTPSVYLRVPDEH